MAATGLPPRLLTIQVAPIYMGGVSPWTVRALIGGGTLPKVTIPLANGWDFRRVLIDRADIDALVERSKERPA